MSTPTKLTLADITYSKIVLFTQRLFSENKEKSYSTAEIGKLLQTHFSTTPKSDIEGKNFNSRLNRAMHNMVSAGLVKHQREKATFKGYVNTYSYTRIII